MRQVDLTVLTGRAWASSHEHPDARAPSELPDALKPGAPHVARARHTRRRLGERMMTERGSHRSDDASSVYRRMSWSSGVLVGRMLTATISPHTCGERRERVACGAVTMMTGSMR